MRKLSATSRSAVRSSRISAHLIGRDRVVKVRTPVIVFLAGGQQAASESTSVTQIAEKPWLAHVFRDVLSDVERNTVDVTNWLDARHTASRRLKPFRPQVCAL